MMIRPLVPVRSIVAVLLAPSALLAQQSPPTALPRDSIPATLLGQVVDSTGKGLARAEITIGHPVRTRVIANDSGGFRITGLPPGNNVFDVRRLGYAAAAFTANLKPGKTHQATFQLSAVVRKLETVAVSDSITDAPGDTHWLDVFEQRRKTHHGTFFTRAEIERSGARTGTDIIRSVAGIRMTMGKHGLNEVHTRGIRNGRQCTPSMFLHNVPYSGTLEDFQASDIEALELYLGVSEVPEELDKDGRGYCGAIVVWTRDPRTSP